MITGLVFLNALLASLPPVDAATSTFSAQPVYAFEPQAAAPAATSAPADTVVLGWTGNVSVGASYSDGNTDSRSVNAAGEAVRRAEKDRWTAKAYWNYSSERDSTGAFAITQRRAGSSLKYDYFVSKTLYLFGVAGIETDTLADIKTRTYIGPGAGYQWHEDEELKWGSEVGVTSFNTDFKVSEDNDYIAARLANNISWKINENTKVENTLEAFPSLENAKDIYCKSDTKVKVTLSKTLFAQLQWIYQYTARPADTAERTDNLLVLGIGWSF